MIPNKKVLIVDDNMCCRDILKTILVKAGYEVVEAKNGEEGVKVAANCKPDAVILDVMMPVMDGWGVCRALRASNITVPVIMLTAKTQRCDEWMSWEAGATEYLCKPFKHSELLSILEKNINSVRCV